MNSAYERIEQERSFRDMHIPFGEELSNDFPPSFNRFELESVLQLVGCGSASLKSLLDVGCADCRVSENPFVAKGVQRYVGLDHALGVLRSVSARKNAPCIVAGSMLEIPFADNSFDGVIAIQSLMHVPGDDLRRQAVREFYRVLVPGGRLVLTVITPRRWRKYLGSILHSDSDVVEGFFRNSTLPVSLHRGGELIESLVNVGFHVTHVRSSHVLPAWLHRFAPGMAILIEGGWCRVFGARMRQAGWYLQIAAVKS